MKTRIFTLALMFCLGAMPSVVLGQSSGTPTKIGLINIQEAIVSTAEGKKAAADLQRKYQPRQQEIQKLQQEMQAINDQLQKQAATLSEEEQRRLSRDLEDKQKIAKRSTEDAQADFSSDRDEAFRRVGQKMVKVIEDYARENNFTLVIGSDQVPIYYAVKELDLTEAIVQRYDAANPAGAPVSGGPAAPAHHAGSSTAKSPK